MKASALTFSLFLLLTVGHGSVQADDIKPVRVLMLSGQNNHNWRETTPRLKQILQAGGRFLVDVTEHPEECNAELLAPYDVLLSNWNTFGQPSVTNWPPAMREAFVNFVRSGKGVVAVHGGSSSFYDWPEYQQLAGAVWGKETSHGKMHTNRVVLIAVHPITAGFGNFETYDEFWQNAQVVPGARPLATVTPGREFGGSGKPEPVAFATEFGRGRSFTLLLGHDARAMESDGFQQLLRRGTEWAATGKVSNQAPR